MSSQLQKTFSWVILENASNIMLQLLSVVILSRILSPHDYGILGTVSIFIAISNMIVDSGMGGSLLRKKEITKTDYSTIFVFNLCISLLIYLILYIIAPIIATAYNNIQITKIIRIISITIFINATSIIYTVIFLKNLNFKYIFNITIISNLGGFFIALLFAYKGFGVWSIVYQQVAQSSIRVIISFFYTKYIPSLNFSSTIFKEHFKFGIHIMSSNLLYILNNNIYSSLISKYFSFTISGYYVQSSRLQNLPTSLITSTIDKAIYPTLVKMKSKNEILSYSRLIFRFIYTIIFPLLFIISALSKELILIILGTKWEAAYTLFNILIICSIFVCIQTLYKSIFKTLNITNKVLYSEIIKIIIGTSLFFILKDTSITSVIYGILISIFISTLFSSYIISKHLKYSIFQQIKDMIDPILLSILLYMGIQFLKYILNDSHIVLIISICFLYSITTIIAFGYLRKNKEVLYFTSKIKTLFNN